MNSSLKTLVYADIFSFPLTKKEWWRRQIAPSLPFVLWEKEITRLLEEGKVKEKGGYFFLPGKEKNVLRRRQEEKIFKKKQKLIKKAVFLLKKIPLVWLVGLTGRLAHGVAREDDDIDLLVITAPFSLWIARLWIYGLFFLWGRRWGLKIRRPFQKKAPNALCFNLFLDRKRLSLPAQNVFFAYEAAFFRP
ncbi:hypothetical protein J7J95_01425, partial [bacterium]|nr:hypothetical protein [bacterium]